MFGQWVLLLTPIFFYNFPNPLLTGKTATTLPDGNWTGIEQIASILQGGHKNGREQKT